MTRAVRNRLIARIAARRRGEQGLTLIELLLSLAILAILTGFLAGGLSMSRRAFATDRASEIGSETSRRPRPWPRWWGRCSRSGLTGQAQKTPSDSTVAARRSPLWG